MTLLTVNTGSSSVRLALWEREGQGPLVTARHELSAAGAEELLASFLGERGGGGEGGAAGAVEVVAHRVVHGGRHLVTPCLIDRAVEETIGELGALAPLHNRRALEWIEACRQVLGRVPQVAVFDTAFFADLPAQAATYALPRRLAEQHGLRRFGFHGLAHRSMWSTFCRLHPERGGRGRVISLQLGSGCSAAAVVDGHPVDTSMGFSPLEGLVMATRPGDVDPGILIYLARTAGLPLDELDRLLARESGLLGLSGLSGDLRTLLAKEAEEEGARLAVEVYCHRVRKYLGAYLAVLGGAEAILVGGGAGEHLGALRVRLLQGMAWCGVGFDEDANRAAMSGAPIALHTPESACEIWVVPVDEERILRDDAFALLAKKES